jgi:hypothetical protein
MGDSYTRRTKKKPARNPGPWHIVNRLTGKHHGPFSSELDCVMARAIATPDWSTGIDMDREAFDRHLRGEFADHH